MAGFKAVEAVAKTFMELQPWLKSISNHLYCCAACSERQDPTMIRAKRYQLANHIQDKHRGHIKLFTECLHGDPEHGTKWKK